LAKKGVLVAVSRFSELALGSLLKMLFANSPTKSSSFLSEPINQNLRRRFEAENRVLASICEYRTRFGKSPGVNQLTQFAGCHKSTASRVLARFQLDWLRKKNQDERLYLYMQSNFDKPKDVTERDRYRLTDAEFALLRTYPEEVWFLTVVCPSDSEIAYLEMSQASGEIPFRLVEKLLTALRKVPTNPLFAYRWEIQTCGKLHCHLYIHISGSVASHTQKINMKLHRAWCATLDELDEKTSCNPFLSEKGNNERYVDCWCNALAWKERDQQKYPFTYIAKLVKEHRRLRQWRSLNILSGQKIGTNSPSGVSPALKKLVRESMIEQKVSSHPDRRDAERVVDDIVSVVNPSNTHHQWQNYGYEGGDTGQRCRILLDDLDTILQSCHAISIREIKQQHTSACDVYEVRFKLTSAGFLSVYVYFRRKLNQDMTNCRSRKCLLLGVNANV
jgi:hypothetical protein